MEEEKNIYFIVLNKILELAEKEYLYHPTQVFFKTNEILEEVKFSKIDLDKILHKLLNEKLLNCTIGMQEIMISAKGIQYINDNNAIENDLQSIKELIKNDQLEDAIELLIEYTNQNQKYQNEVIAFSGRLNKLNKEIRNNLLDYETQSRMRSKLVNDTLELLVVLSKSVEKENLKKNNSNFLIENRKSESIELILSALSTGLKYTITVNSEMLVSSLIKKILNELNISNHLASGHDMAFYIHNRTQGKSLDNSKTLKENGVIKGDVINLIGNFDAG